MNTRILLGVGILLLSAKGCTYLTEVPNDIYTTYIIDVTDTLTTEEELQNGNYQRVLPLKDNSYQGIQCGVKKVSDSRYTESYQVFLPAHNRLEENEAERPAEIATFKQQLSGKMSTILDNPGPLKQSFVLHAIFSTVQAYSTLSDSLRRDIYVVSDLAENTPFFSVYRSKDFLTLTQKPEQLSERLAKEYPLEQSLAGISIHFIHQSTTKTDIIFHEMAHFLSQYFTDYGATVVIVSSFDEIQIKRHGTTSYL